LRDAATADEPYELARALTEDERSTTRIHFRRLHVVNNRPIGLTDSWLASNIVPLTEDAQLHEGSLSKSLAEYGIEASRIDHVLEVGTANSTEAGLLRTDLDAPLFVDWSIGRLADGSLLETSRTVWLASRVRFHYLTDVDSGKAVVTG
jgi:GntR family transcriptional regulator